MSRESEYKEKVELEKKFGFNKITIATQAMIKYEVEISFKETAWKKGLVLLEELDKLGYEIVPKA